MNNETPELTAEDIRTGKHLWYIVVENTNSRMVNKEDVPIIFTSWDVVDNVAKRVSRKFEAPYVAINVAEYNRTFRRFMELDG